jgi:hypothetical protein
MIKVSRDSRIWALWTLIIVGTGYSCVSGKLDWKVAGGILVALGLPSLLNEKKEGTK